jgi:hypothetical protein
VISRSVDPLAGFVLLVIRGFLLWVLIPLSVVAWFVGAWWFIPNHVTLDQFLGWIDNNFVVGLERSILRPFFPQPTIPWVPFADIRKVTHRIGAQDLF